MSNTGDPLPDQTRDELPDAATAAAATADAAATTTAPNGATADGALVEGEQRAGDDVVIIHRSPRYFRFMTAGAILGLVVALVLTFAFPEPPGFNPGQIFGFLAILFVIVGIAAGAVVALVIDRVSRRNARTIEVERIESGPAE